MFRRYTVHAFAAFAFVLLVAGAVSLSGNSPLEAAGAPAACNLATLAASYGFMYTGPLFLGADGLPAVGGTRADDASVGVITADGRGGLTYTQYISLDGKVDPAQGTGSYTMNADCTGKGTLSYSTGLTLHVSFVLAEQGGELKVNSTDAGTGVSGIETPMAGGCSNAAAASSYAYTFSGFRFLPDGTRVDIAATGLNVLDAAGNFSYADVESNAGAITPRTGSGTQNVSADCTGSGTIALPSGFVLHTAFVVVDGGEEQYIIVTDQGATLTGIATRQ